MAASEFSHTTRRLKFGGLIAYLNLTILLLDECTCIIATVHHFETVMLYTVYSDWKIIRLAFFLGQRPCIL